MTTYKSKTSFVPVVPGPTVIKAFDAAFPLADAYVLSQEIPRPEELPVDTLEGGLSWTGVMEAISEAPQSHAEGRTERTPIPVRYVALVFLGLVLVGLGLAREPIALLLWGLR